MSKKRNKSVFDVRQPVRQRAAEAWRVSSLAAGAAVAMLPGSAALAHGFAGARFFPATILTDDPFVADEMSLPTLTRAPDAPDGAQFYSIETDIAKRITPDFGLTWSDAYDYVQPPGLPKVTGLDTMTAGAQDRKSDV